MENENIDYDKINNIQNSFFKKIDENSGVFYFIIALVCLFIFVTSIAYFLTRVKYDKENQVYYSRNSKDIYEFKIENTNHYTNQFYSDTEDIEVKKENEYSSLVFTEFSSTEETDNLKINTSLPKINISSEVISEDINMIKSKVIEVNNRIQTVRTVFEGNNKLNFDYYAFYYQNSLSFGYSYYEIFSNKVEDENYAFVYNFDKGKTLTLNEYLKSRNMNETKVSEILKEIIRREKLKYKYNKRTKDFYVDSRGGINLIIDNKTKLSINVK